MRPPICDVCGARPAGDDVDGFATLRFADHEPLPDGMTGHAKGLQWLCGKHGAAAQELTDLTWPEALEVLRASSGWRRLMAAPGPRSTGGHLQQVVEPLGVRRSTGALFGLFAASGAVAGIVVFSSGEWLFGILFSSMFIGIPWVIHRASRGPGVPGFTLTSDGILGAAENEHGLITWGEVDRLAWLSTGLTVNDAPCLTLHAELVDGRRVRVMTYTARRGREVEDVEVQVRATGLLPERVRFGFGEGRRDPGRPASPTSDAVAPSATPAPARDWSDLPLPLKVMLVSFILAFFAPFAIGLVAIPIVLFSVGGPFAWIATAVLVASSASFLKALVQRRRDPVLACAFTVEGVVSEFGDGLTVPWVDDMALRIDPGSIDGGTDAGTGGQGWVVRLHRPEASSIQLSKVLTSRARVQRAVAELANARKQGLIPADVTLTLPPDFPPAPF